MPESADFAQVSDVYYSHPVQGDWIRAKFVDIVAIQVAEPYLGDVGDHMAVYEIPYASRSLPIQIRGFHTSSSWNWLVGVSMGIFEEYEEVIATLDGKGNFSVDTHYDAKREFINVYCSTAEMTPPPIDGPPRKRGSFQMRIGA